MPGYANPQNLNRYSYVTNNPLRYTDPTGHMLSENEYGGGCSTSGYCPGSTTPQAPSNPGGGGNDDDDDNNNPPGGGGSQPEPSPIIGDVPPPVSPTICAVPMWGNPPSCVDIFPDIEITVGIKPWENIDKIDLAVDVAGIIGDLALAFGGPPGVILWAVTEVPEIMTIGRSFDQMETGDPAGAVSVVVDTVIPVAQAVRLAPAGGWVGNLAGIGLNVLQVEVQVIP